MKEIESHLNINNNIELNVKKKQEIEYVFEGTIKPKKGHIVWEINEETGDIKPAEYKVDTVSLLPSFAIPAEKLIINKDCVYIPALNIKNAKKKYLENKEQSFYFTKKPLMNISDITFK